MISKIVKSDEPVSLDQNEGYRKENSRLLELQFALAGNEADIEKCSHSSSLDTLTERALARLDGPSDAQFFDAGAAASRVTRLLDERRVLRSALSIQRVRLRESVSAASKEIAGALLPRHRALVAEVARAAEALALANQREEDFRFGLDAAGVTYQSAGLRPLAFCARYIGRLQDHESGISRFKRELAEFGYGD